MTLLMFSGLVCHAPVHTGHAGPTEPSWHATTAPRLNAPSDPAGFEPASVSDLIPAGTGRASCRGVTR